MSTFATTAARTSAVKSVGAAERKSAEIVTAIIAGLPEDFDFKARGAVAEIVHVWAAGSVEDAPAVRKGSKGEQVTTDYGRGHETIVKAVKRALAKDDDTPKARSLRVTLSGEGGGSTTVAEDHPLYAALVALVTGEASDEDLVASIIADAEYVAEVERDAERTAA